MQVVHLDAETARDEPSMQGKSRWQFVVVVVVVVVDVVDDHDNSNGDDDEQVEHEDVQRGLAERRHCGRLQE